jgi:hypothetical protein
MLGLFSGSNKSGCSRKKNVKNIYSALSGAASNVLNQKRLLSFHTNVQRGCLKVCEAFTQSRSAALVLERQPF